MQAATRGGPSKGARQEMERVFQENHRMVLRTAFRVTGNVADAEDVLQNLFLRLVRTGRPFELRNGLQSYLHRAAINLALDLVRKRKHTVDLTDVKASALKDRKLAAEELRSNSELRTWLRQALANLSPRTAEVFVLRHFEGYSNAEIARLLNTSRTAVGVILFRAHGRLRKQLRSFLGGRS